MAFGICRIRNLKLGDISSTDLHNARRYDSVENYPKNISPEGRNVTRYLDENGDFQSKEQTTLNKVLQEKLQKENVVGQRSNSNVAIEYVLTVNDQEAWKNYSASGYFSQCLEWLENRHGKGSVLAMSEHYDESNPHAHFIVVPLVTKEIKWKNRNGEGVKKETRIDTRSWTGGRQKLRQLQNDYHQFVKGFEEKMGVEFHRGTLVENQTRQYVQQTDHIAGQLRAQINDLEKNNPTLTEKVVDALKSLKNAVLGNFYINQIFNKTLVEEIQRRKEVNKNGYWQKKGAQKDYFHGEKSSEKPKDKGMEM